jgi:hypothetical protein
MTVNVLERSHRFGASGVPLTPVFMQQGTYSYTFTSFIFVNLFHVLYVTINSSVLLQWT